MAKALDFVMFMLVITVLWFFILSMNVFPEQRVLLLYSIPIFIGLWIVGMLDHFMYG